MNQGDSDVQGLQRARVVTYDPVRRVGKLKLVPQRGRDLQFFLSMCWSMKQRARPACEICSPWET